MACGCSVDRSLTARCARRLLDPLGRRVASSRWSHASRPAASAGISARGTRHISTSIVPPMSDPLHRSPESRRVLEPGVREHHDVGLGRLVEQREHAAAARRQHVAERARFAQPRRLASSVEPLEEVLASLGREPRAFGEQDARPRRARARGRVQRRARSRRVADAAAHERVGQAMCRRGRDRDPRAARA